MPFSIVCVRTGWTEIVLEGDLDVATVGRLRVEFAGMARRPPIRVRLDVAGLRSVNARDGLTLGALISDLARTGHRITVTGVGDQPLDWLNAAQVDLVRDGRSPLC